MFKVGQLVRQNDAPFVLIMIVTSASIPGEFSGRVVVNQDDFHMHNVGELITGIAEKDFSPYTNELVLGAMQNKFKKGDFVQSNGAFGNKYTGMVIDPGKERFAVVIITSESEVIESGEEYRFERYTDWDLTTITIKEVTPPTPTIKVGDRLQNIYASNHNMIIVTEITNMETGEFSGVLVYSEAHPDQVGTTFQRLNVDMYIPYEEVK